MSLDRIVEIAFGYGPFDTVGAWTDVSDFVAVHGDTVFATMTRGRSGGGIAPGSASVTFENSDGRFDPRNTGGPYHGQLKVGTPIRFRCPTAGDPDGTVWSGFISSGWPTALTTTFPTVTVTAHDLFGLLAQGSAPATAFDAAVRSLAGPPDHWWRPGPTGWVDQITGVTARHTGGLEEMDPVVNGDTNSWGQSLPDGYGHTTNPAGVLGVDAGHTGRWDVISAWVRLVEPAERAQFDSGTPGSSLVVRCDGVWSGGLTGVQPRAWMQIEDSLVFMFVTPSGKVTASAPFFEGTYWSGDPTRPIPGMLDGQVHHLLVAGRAPYLPAGTPEAHAWLDGRHMPMESGWITSSTHTAVFTPAQTMLAGRVRPDSYIPGGSSWFPTQGVVDHVMLWSGLNTTVDDLESLAGDLFTAGRDGWAGQRLDERAANLVTAMHAGDRIGSFDVSGITTLQSYRQGEALQLLQTIEDTEQGRIWVDRHGDMRYSRRSWAWDDARSTMAQASFSTVGTDIDTGAIVMLEDGTEIVDDPLDLVNVAQVTSAFGRMQTVTDDTSISDVGQRNPVHLSGLLHRSDAESRAIAEWVVASRSTARPRARQVTFDGDDPNAGGFTIDVSEGDLVTVTVGAPLDCDGDPIGSDLYLSAHVTQVTRAWSRDRHTVTLSLDSTRTDSTWFRWGTSEWDNTDSEGWSF